MRSLAADWSLDSLCQKIGDHVVTCSTTPDGRADSVVQNDDQGLCFAQPHTQQLPFRAFKALLDDTTASGVPSIQFQNSNLTEELPELVGDVEASIGWASTAFGCEPDAVNIWVGDKRCSTSFHKVWPCRKMHRRTKLWRRRLSCDTLQSMHGMPFVPTR